MKDQAINEPTEDAALDNWYGGQKKVGVRDIVVGLTFIGVIVLTMIVSNGFKEFKEQAQLNKIVTCPKCNHTFQK